MLDNERWWNAIESYIYLQQKWKDIDASEKDASLIEHYKTQIANEALGLGPNLPRPNELPHMGEVIGPEEAKPRADKVTSTSVIGMPNSGKTTTIRTIIESREMEVPTTVNEAYDEEKTKLDNQGKFDFETLLKNVLLRQYPEYNKAILTTKDLCDSGLNSETLAIFDRLCWTDLPMIRTHFLLGNIRSGVLQMFENFFLDTFASENRFTNNVVVSALIMPMLSLNRQGSGESRGRTMNPPFLHVLYEQYIRFHYEMLNFEKVYNVKRDFTYCAVDMSGDGYERFRSLEKAINWSHIAASGEFTTEGINELIKKSF